MPELFESHAKRNIDLKPWFFLILIMVLVTVFVNARLRDSKMGRAWVADQANLLDDAVNGEHATGEDPVIRQAHAQLRALRKNLPPGFTHFDQTAVPGAPWMHADDVFFLGPYRHYRSQIGMFKREIECLFGFLGSGESFRDHHAPDA